MPERRYTRRMTVLGLILAASLAPPAHASCARTNTCHAVRARVRSCRRVDAETPFVAEKWKRVREWNPSYSPKPGQYDGLVAEVAEAVLVAYPCEPAKEEDFEPYAVSTRPAPTYYMVKSCHGWEPGRIVEGAVRGGCCDVFPAYELACLLHAGSLTGLPAHLPAVLDEHLPSRPPGNEGLPPRGETNDFEHDSRHKSARDRRRQQ